MNKKAIFKEFREKFVDHWEGLGQAVVYPIKDGVSSIIPAEDIEQWLSQKLDEVEERVRKEMRVEYGRSTMKPIKPQEVEK